MGTLRGVDAGMTGAPPPPVAGRVTGGPGGPASGVKRGRGGGGGVECISGGGVARSSRIGVAFGVAGGTRGGVALPLPGPFPSKVCGFSFGVASGPLSRIEPGGGVGLPIRGVALGSGLEGSGAGV